MSGGTGVGGSDDCESFVSSSGGSGSIFTHRRNNTIMQQQALFLNSSNGSGASKLSKPAVFYVFGGYCLDQRTLQFVALNDLWKCELLFNPDQEEFANECICSPCGEFELIFDNYSYCIDENGVERDHDDVENLTFHGLTRHSLEGSNWPKPRGFASLLLIDNDDIGAVVDGLTGGNASGIASTNGNGNANGTNSNGNGSVGSPLNSPNTSEPIDVHVRSS
ncbi:unnamed protein product [Ambrosiozyma monospora]|uniref:Unnamed protein product n=1 Tax=Ambrosiozyma monospora TaxID=43982 RepID=A0ACB5U991_AMBMO|nr:unnamed protein product [Ambrosiozyma monospora]